LLNLYNVYALKTSWEAFHEKQLPPIKIVQPDYSPS